MVCTAGIQKLKEREYLGTIQSCKVSTDYAAVRFEGKVNLHMVRVSAFTITVMCMCR